MALTSERGMGKRLRAWSTVKAAIALGLWLAFSQSSWAQDPLNDVHVEPKPPAATTPVTPADPKAQPAAPAPLEGKKALSARANERMRVDVNLVLVPVTVTDPLNRLVTGLERQDFFVYENNALQKPRTPRFRSASSSISAAA
jgi:Ca-activated chloride channel family protein